jgi:hypothetical protein
VNRKPRIRSTRRSIVDTIGGAEPSAGAWLPPLGRFGQSFASAREADGPTSAVPPTAGVAETAVGTAVDREGERGPPDAGGPDDPKVHATSASAATTAATNRRTLTGG